MHALLPELYFLCGDLIGIALPIMISVGQASSDSLHAADTESCLPMPRLCRAAVQLLHAAPRKKVACGGPESGNKSMLLLLLQLRCRQAEGGRGPHT